MPKELLAKIFVYACSDIIAYFGISLTCRLWKGTLNATEETIWRSLTKLHHPIIEEMEIMLDNESADQNACAQNSEVVPTTNRKERFRKRSLYLRGSSDSTYLNSSLNHPPPELSKYLFQVDLKCTIAKPDKTRIVSKLIHGDADVIWSSDHVYIDLLSIKNELANFQFIEAEVAVHVIEKESRKQALLYKGHSVERVDVNLLYFTHFSPPQSLLSSFGCSGFVSSDRCDCDCPNRDQKFFDKYRPHFYYSCECGDCGDVPQECQCCDCEEPWDCFHEYGIMIHPYGHIIDDLGKMEKEDFLRFLEKGLNYT